MSFIRINGVNIFYEIKGKGEPIVCVHGSWGDHQVWERAAEILSKDFTVLTYDRRGHSQSERQDSQGTINEDSDDLAGLVKTLGFSTAYICGNSFGAAITLRTAIRHPEVIRKIIVNEPPLFDLLEGNEKMKDTYGEIRTRLNKVAGILESGEIESGTRMFFEIVAGQPGDWKRMSEKIQKKYIFNASTWLDENKDPEALKIDLNALAGFKKPVLLTRGSVSPPFFHVIIDVLKEVLPNVTLHVYQDAGHTPYASHPAEYAKRVKEFITGK